MTNGHVFYPYNYESVTSSKAKQRIPYSNTGALPDSWTIPGIQWVLILAVEMNEQIPTAKHNGKTHGRCSGNVCCDLTALSCPMPTTE